MPNSLVTLTGEQLRAGRALTRLGQAEIGRMARVSVETVKRLERFQGPVEANSRTLSALVDAFNSVGVSFQTYPDTVSVCLHSRPSPVVPRPARNRRSSYRLIYWSTARLPPGVSMLDALQAIVPTAAARNRALGICSSLMACDGRFLHVLEGPREGVWQAFGTLSIDPRHTAIQMIQSGDIDVPTFSEVGLSASWFEPGDPIFTDEPAMATGFAPERLSPAAALSLLCTLDRIVGDKSTA